MPMEPRMYVPPDARDEDFVDPMSGVNMASEGAQRFGATVANYPKHVWQGLEDLMRPLPGKGLTEEEIAQRVPATTNLALGMVGAPRVGVPEGAVGSGIKPIRAYHGSPHDFEKFDINKIGTGEGAQAYGHGLYFAENERVAKGYRERLSDRAFNSDDGPVSAGHAFTSLQDIGQRVGNLHPDQSYQLAKQVIDKIERGAPLNDIEYPVKKFQDAYEAMTMEAQRRGFAPNPGRMYEVNIHAQPEQFLDWDKPLAQQTDTVKKALNEGWLAHPETSAHETGADIYRQTGISGRIFGRNEQRPYATEKLNDLGIPGIKYLDQGSRNAGGWHITPPDQTVSGKWMVKSNNYNSQGLHFDTKAQAEAALNEKIGSQTSNYVLFRDDIIDILRKYGIAGLSMLPPAVAASVKKEIGPQPYVPPDSR